MLSSLNLNDKTYEELMAEALAQIPLYSREWTHHGVSDPGITLLQNLTAFQLLQQELLNSVSEEVLLGLLKLAGLSPRESRPAVTLVQAPPRGGPTLPAGHQFWSGDIPFEIAEPVSLRPWSLAAVYTCQDGRCKDVTHLLNPTADTSVQPFGHRPAAGGALVCILSGIPERDEPVHLWLQAAEDSLRTPFAEGEPAPRFSRVRWQYYTASGWQDAETADETHGLLCSGAVTLRLKGGIPAVLDSLPVQGRALRCLLEEADYDRAPRLRSLSVHLFPVVQKETLACCHVLSGGERVTVQSRLALLGNLFVFCREAENEPYRLYREAPPGGASGRFYRREECDCGVTLWFDPSFGAPGPCIGPDAVRVSCFDSETVHQRSLGPVYGYENQIIRLELFKDALPEDLLLAVETPEPDGGAGYRFFSPNGTEEDFLHCRLLPREGALVVNPSGANGETLYLAGCSVTRGEQGNLRPQAVLKSRSGHSTTEAETEWLCPAPGRFGMTREGAEALQRRLSAHLRQPSAAVRAADYEELVRQTPGLCIHKVKAVAGRGKNLIQIAVKPHGDEPFPRLPSKYLRQIRAFLEPRRMLTARIEILQPRYVPLGISAVLSVRGMASRVREEAESLLRQELDYVNGSQNFGECVRFETVFRALSGLSCVEAVESLSLFPESRGALPAGSDIHLEPDCLCYPGTIHLTLRERMHL